MRQAEAPVATAYTAEPLNPSRRYEDRKRESAEKNKRERAFKALKDRVAELEARIADREKAIKDVEQTMAAPGLLLGPRKIKAGPGPAPGPDVGSRRASGPVGDAPKRS